MKLLLQFIFLLLMLPMTLLAERHNVALLHNGMTRTELIQLWGPPDYRDEREVKHEELWYYGDVTVTIFEDAVSRWVGGDSYIPGSILPPPSATKQAPGSKHVTKSIGFDELLNDVPDEGGGTTTTLGGGVLPGGMPSFPGGAPSQFPPPPGFDSPPTNGGNSGLPSLLEQLRNAGARGAKP